MDQSFLSSLPTKPGVYLFKDPKNKILYVGKAKNIKNRVSSYFSQSPHDLKTTKLVGEVKTIDFIIVESEIEAFLLESNLIKKHLPFYNIKMIDDKSYPYLKITKKDVPSVTIVRKRLDKRALYFGPYPDGSSIKVILKILRRIFPFESVENHQKTKCLYFHIGLCPCASVVPENIPQYKKNIKKLTLFLEGKKDSVIKILKTDQKEAILKEEFEKAASIQSTIEKIEYITSSAYDPFKYLEKPDYFFQRLKAELESLSETLSKYKVTNSYLKRIECFDISNIQGTNPTASMVVAIDGDMNKTHYRKFKIKSKNTPDDFAMMREVITRRMNHRDDWGMPDLLIVDGGKGQVSSAMRVILGMNLDIPLIGLAKREETIVIPAVSYGKNLEFLEIKLPQSNPGVNLLKKIRDEAHRFAITYHRKLRSKSTLK